MTDFMTDHAASYVRVKAPALGEVAEVVTARGGDVDKVDGELRVTGVDAPTIGEAVAQRGLALHELTLVRSSLEDAFMTLTADSVEYSAGRDHHELEGATR